jgi:hypothetical protein
VLLLLISWAWASPTWVSVPEDVARDWDAFDVALEAAAGANPIGVAGPVLVTQRADGTWIEAESLLPEIPPVPDKEPWATSAIGPGGPPVDAPGASTGSLSGKAIYGSQCHGWIWYDSLGRFSTQRGNVHDTVEDFHNPEGMNQYLFRYLENAGAAVFSAKERDHNPNMAIADNDAEGYSESGSGFEDGPAGFADMGTYDYGDNPFDAGSTRRFPADGGASASWIPEVPADGLYALYVSWDSDPDNTSTAHYRITHSGGVIDRWYDQRVHGSTWQYVDTLWLTAGVDGLTVELVADSDEAGTYLSADAVRIGGGMGDVQRHGGTSGRPRHAEGAILYNQFNGAPTSVYDPWEDGNGSDPSTRSRWAKWEHPSGEDAIYLSWHSNAFDGTARGTITYMYEGSLTAVDGSLELAEAVQSEMIDAIGTLWADEWYDRGIGRASFSEVNPSHNDEMPAALVELAFHDNAEDAAYLKEPAFRDDMSRAMYRAIVRYFAERDGDTPRFLPEPPTDLSIVHNGLGVLVARWEPGVSGTPFGDAATGYRVYRSADGKSWDNGTSATDPEAILLSDPGETVFVRVTATNDGGESFPTETLGARRSPDGWAPILVVSAFDRLEASNLVWDEIGGSLGTVVRMPLDRINGFDTTVPAATGVSAAGWYFDSVSDEQLSTIALEDYMLVLWVAGEESTADETFDSAQQAQIRQFVEAGGALWASGAEIGWDLDYRGDASDRAFAEEVLGIAMADDDAGTTDADGLGILAGLLLDFGEEDGAPYPVEYPDVLASDHEVIVSYPDGATAGVLGERVAVFGFPFECIGDASTRDEVMARLLPALVPDYTPPDPDAETSDTGDVDERDDTGAPEVDDGSGDDRVGADSPKTADGASKDKGCGCATGTRPPGREIMLLVVGLLGVRRRTSQKCG